MRKNKSILLPAAFTSANLVFGVLAIIRVLEGDLPGAGWLIFIAAIFDGLDGKIARLVNNATNFGKAFDSIADVVSFGVAPALLAYKVYFHQHGVAGLTLVFLYVVCGGLRLARYTADPESGKRSTFMGLPIPMAAITVASFIHFNYHYWDSIRLGGAFVALFSALCLLMVSRISYDKLPRLSFRETGGNLLKLSILAGGLILIAIFPAAGFFPLCMIYLSHGPVRYFSRQIRIALERAD